MSSISETTQAEHAVYSPASLRMYDLWVMGLSNHWIWRCPTHELASLYDRHVTDNHLDVGVGTGYLLDRARFPSRCPRVALMDLNPNPLDHCARRIARYAPEIIRRNVLEPIAYDGRPFDSVGMNYILHCLPGSIGEKAVAFDHLLPLMSPGARLFGATLLQGGVQRSSMARWLMDVYNKRSIFSNRDDDLDGLKRALSERFEEVSVAVVGCAALFSGRKPR